MTCEDDDDLSYVERFDILMRDVVSEKVFITSTAMQVELHDAALQIAEKMFHKLHNLDDCRMRPTHLCS